MNVKEKEKSKMTGFLGRESGSGNNRRKYMIENWLGKVDMCCWDKSSR